MPQVLVRYNPRILDEEQLRELGEKCRGLVANAASTEEVPFTVYDIDWVTQANGPGSIAPNIAIEIRTIGRPERKAKLNQECLEQLKRDFLAAGFIRHIDESEPLIWMIFTDPDGAHV